MSDTKEVWVGVKGYNKYAVSNFGRVMNLETGFMLSAVKNKRRAAMPQVSLSQSGIQKKMAVGYLVAEAFFKDYDSELTVEHIDGDKENCRADNMKMSTEKKRGRRA